MENDQLVLPSVTKQKRFGRDRDSDRQAIAGVSTGWTTPRRRRAVAFDAGILDAQFLGAHASLLDLGSLEGSLDADSGDRTAHRGIQQGRRLVCQSVR